MDDEPAGVAASAEVAAPPFDLTASDTPPFEVSPDDSPVVEKRFKETGPVNHDSLVGKSVYVIDANSLIFQVFHGIPEMTSPAGEPVNAVFGFTRDLLFMLEKKKPDYLFIAFDLEGPTFRHELYEPYKGERAEMPVDLIPQFASIRRMLDALNMAVLGVPRYEADDILATLARETALRGGDCYLVSGDKDCRQLLSERVKIYNVRKDQFYDAASLQQDWGVRPEQVVDFQSLVGDSVDNVPGVPLIGPKNARELLEQYETLENVFANVDKVSAPKRRVNLKQFQAQALLSRQLVRLDVNVPLELDWDRGLVTGFDTNAALALCNEFGFHRIAQQIRALHGGGTAPPIGATSTMNKSSGITSAPVMPAQPEAEWVAEYRTVDTPEKFAAFLDELRQQASFSFDTETTHVSPMLAELVGSSFCWKAGEAYYLPFRGPEGSPVLDLATTLEQLRPILCDPAIGKVGQNLKYDMLMLRTAGVDMRGVAFDTMVASYLLEAGERVHNMDELSLRHLNHTTIKISELIGTGKQQKRMDEVPIDVITRYAAEDADVPWRLQPVLDPKLREFGLDRLFREVELPLIDVLAELEFNGIRVDTERLNGLSKSFGERMAITEQEIYEIAGHPFNIASPKQLQQVLFTELGLPIISRTKTGASTDVDVLEELARSHPLPAKIIDYRQYAKLKGTYVDALPTMVNPRTGRVHCSFHQAVAATGRLSSSDPNLQNIPIRTEVGREIRSAFLPAEGWQLVAADYSQIELRVLAHYSQDETLCEAFARDEDIHALVASQVYNVPIDQVSKDQRRAAKAVNFGIVYGQSAFGLAKAINIEQKEAQLFIDAYFARYPGVERFMNDVLVTCAEQGFVSTILGRRRAIKGIRTGASRQRNVAERTAINTVIQGSAADLIKLAMIAIDRRMKREKVRSKMLLQIHDELMFEAPPEEIESLRGMIAEEMSGVMSLRVPLKVDVKQGRNWAEIE